MPWVDTRRAASYLSLSAATIRWYVDNDLAQYQIQTHPLQAMGTISGTLRFGILPGADIIKLIIYTTIARTRMPA